MSAAAALDAADGVIDGRHFGRPIVQAGPQFIQGGPQFIQGAPQFVQGAQFVQAGPQFVQAAPQFASAYPAFGTQFAGTQFAPQFAGTQFAGTQFAPQFATGFAGPTFGASSTAAALDAADGVIDGKHFGRQIVQAAPQVAYGGPAFGSFVGSPAFAPTFGAPTTFVGGASSTAAALDAADGVIDGKHFGRPIVQAGGPQIVQGGLVPYTGVQQMAAVPTTFASAPAFNFGGAIPAASYFGGQRFAGYGAPVASYGQAYPQAYPAYGQTFGQGFVQGAPVANYGFPQQFGAPAQSRAAQLDAADGVIDGKFFGRQIVQRR